MGALDRIKQAVTGPDSDPADGPSDASGPAAASGDTSTPTGPMSSTGSGNGGGEMSDGPSGGGNAETALGGADAVPDTPDGVVEDFT